MVQSKARAARKAAQAAGIDLDGLSPFEANLVQQRFAAAAQTAAAEEAREARPVPEPDLTGTKRKRKGKQARLRVKEGLPLRQKKGSGEKGAADEPVVETEGPKSLAVDVVKADGAEWQVDKICRDCGESFTFSEEEQASFREWGWAPKARCSDCSVMKKRSRWGLTPAAVPFPPLHLPLCAARPPSRAA